MRKQTAFLSAAALLLCSVATASVGRIDDLKIFRMSLESACRRVDGIRGEANAAAP